MSGGHSTRGVWRPLLASAAIIFVLAYLLLPFLPASAATTRGPVYGARVSAARWVSPGNRMLNWAETQRGAPYRWGGTGPYWAGYDCSGLVWAAARRIHIWLPRTTYDMISSWHLVRTYHPHRGDLAFFGPVWAPYHVEFVTALYDTTFGEHDWGQTAGWARYWPPWWAPSSFYRIR